MNRLAKSTGLLLTLNAALSGQLVIEWDFTRGTHGWTNNPRVLPLQSLEDGLSVVSTGHDPWIEGPVFDFPPDLWALVTIRMTSDTDASVELFYGDRFVAGRSVRFGLDGDGKWHEHRLLVRDGMGQRCRLRLDPCNDQGKAVVARIRVESLQQPASPAFTPPKAVSRPGTPKATVSCGLIRLNQWTEQLGDFTVDVDGQEMASGYREEMLGYLSADAARWLSLSAAETTSFTQPDPHSFQHEARLRAGDNAIWTLRRTVQAAAADGTLTVRTEWSVDADRDVLYLPWFTLFPGLGTFGRSKTQGLFAGVEYLADEPSSSDADIAEPKHIRRVPDPTKITFPLMALTHGGRYIGLSWEPSEAVAAVFDSPDRIYKSQAHLLGLTGPGVGAHRFENELLAHIPMTLKANTPLTVTARIFGGRGDAVVAAVRHYVMLTGLPELPPFHGGSDAAIELLSHGWLDSDANEGGIFRHAVWGDRFRAQPSAESAMFIDWLANHTVNDTLRTRLVAARDLALTRLHAGDPFASMLSHARIPSAPFVFGRLDEFVRQRRKQAENSLRGFDARGVKVYRAQKDKPDYGRTHFADHANGLAGRDVVTVLHGAALCGDRDLIREGLALLDKQTALYGNTVPRGAQTWEVPLHTPDILASAHMVMAYTIGYLLSDDRAHLEQARYWAATGIAFVYLRPATTPEQTGAYATTAVLGATNWRAPYWIGLPVQWCGLVYASALQQLSAYDTEGPWATIANGITLAGLRMSWPESDKERQGLLPDFFHFEQQKSAGPAINPGTVQAHIPEAFGLGKLYDIKRGRRRGWIVHAPCAITQLSDDESGMRFTVDGWGEREFRVLVAGLTELPGRVAQLVPGADQVTSGTEVAESKREFHSDPGYLIITLKGKSRLHIR